VERCVAKFRATFVLPAIKQYPKKKQKTKNKKEKRKKKKEKRTEKTKK
jgi:hypothetical protein